MAWSYTPIGSPITQVNWSNDANSDDSNWYDPVYSEYPNDVYDSSGDDYWRDGDSDDRIFMDAGDDTLVGHGGNDNMRGGDGNDFLIAGTTGSGEVDLMTGEGGADIFRPDSFTPSDSIIIITDFNSGTDLIDLSAVNGYIAVFDSPANIINSLSDFSYTDDYTVATGSTTWFNTSYTGVLLEHSNATAGKNIRILVASKDFADLSNADFISEDLTPTDGDDHLVQIASSAVDIAGLTGGDTIIGNSGNDTIDGGADDDSISGGAGADSLLGGAGLDSLDGDTGNDTIDGGDGNDSIIGGQNDDSLVGGDGNDTLNGASGDDTLKGQGGNDLLKGGAGNDSLIGAQDDDTLKGNDGLDTLTGHSGADTFVASDDNGTDSYDIVTDYVDGTDKLNFAGYSIGFSDLNIYQSGSDVVVEYEGGGVDIGLLIQNETASNLDSSDFIF